MKTTCDIIEDLLPLYLDDACSEESKRAVEEHLSSCEKCKEDLRIMQSKIKAILPDVQEEEIIKAAKKAGKRAKTKPLLKAVL